MMREKTCKTSTTQARRLSIQAISELTVWTGRRSAVPARSDRPSGVWTKDGVNHQQTGNLSTLSGDRLQAGVWNARVLLRDWRERHYGGGYTISHRLAAATTRLGASGRRTALRDRARQAGASGLGASRSLTENGKNSIHCGLHHDAATAEGIMAERLPTPNSAPCYDARAGMNSGKECRKNSSTTG